MGKLKCLEVQRAKPMTELVQFNTSSLFDLMVGTYRYNHLDGHWYLDGGLSTLILGMGGRNGSYKTTLLISLMFRVASIYKDADSTVLDTEFTVIRDTDRMHRFVGELAKLVDEFVTISGTDMDINECMRLLETLCAEKLASKKDLTITTPFISTKTNKPIKTWTPSLFAIDSYSELRSVNENELIEKEGVTGKKTKTIYMQEGGYKTIFLRSVRSMCERYGIILMTTAHVDDNSSMDNAPPRKQMVHMKQSDALKNVGSKYKSLTNPYISIEGCKKLNDSQTYPSKSYQDVDINEMIIKIGRSKTNLSGITVPIVMSQADGFLSPLTNYHYLKNNNYFGLIGSNSNHKLAFMPDIKITRPTVRDLVVDNKRLQRGLQLMAEYCFIRKEWNTSCLPFNMDRTPEELAQAINDHPKLTMDMVLDSVGYWQPNKQLKNYLSLFDILNTLENVK